MGVAERLFMDVRPLRETPDFRRLWLGTSLSAIGGQMTNFAVALQVYTLTGSSFAVGVIGLAMALPAIAFGLLGGTVIDAVDRRKLVLLTSGGLAVVSILFAAQALARLEQLWLLYGLVVVQALLSTVNAPARRTLLPRLLTPDQMPAGVALTMFTFHLSMTAGPALAGVITASWGVQACYLLDALGFLAALYGIVRLPAMVPDSGAARPGFRAVGEGLVFLRRNRIVAAALLTDLNATVLAMPIALFPAINADRFGGGAYSLGLLVAAPAVGGLVGLALSGPLGRVSRQGRGMVIGCAAWGASLACFGLAEDLWLALALLALAGAADTGTVVFRTTVVQVLTPDRYRGRISAAEYVVGAGGPHLGNFRAGAVASLTTPAISAVSGGLSSVAGVALIAWTVPALTAYRARSGPPDDE